MSPNEEHTNVATAEPEPDQEEKLQPPTEPVPDTEQEPSEAEAEPTDESGAGASEDEGEEQAEPPDLNAQMLELLKGIDPEMLQEALPDDMRERLRAPKQDTADATDVEVRGRAVERQQRLQGYDASMAKIREQAWQPMSTSFDQMITGIKRQAEAGEELKVDPGDLSQKIATMGQYMERMGGAHANLQDMEHVRAAIESHPTYRYLSAEDKEALAEPAESFEEFSARAIKVALDAVLARGAPEEVKRQSEADAEKAVGLAEKFERLAGFVGQNGAKKKTVEAGSGGKGRAAFKTRTEIHMAHAAGEITTAQARREFTRLAKAEEG
jgi:hypothetical protein